MNHYDHNRVRIGATICKNHEIVMEITCATDEYHDLCAITYATADDVIREEYRHTRDSLGNIVRTEVRSCGEKATVSVTERTYDSFGNLLSSVQTTAGSICRQDYSPGGALVRCRLYTPDSEQRQTILYRYDENGNEIRSTGYSTDGVPVWETISTYDESGRILSSVDTRFNDAGGTVRKHTALYQWDGPVKITRFPDEPDGTWCLTEYDESGNQIRHDLYAGNRLVSRQTMVWLPDEFHP